MKQLVKKLDRIFSQYIRLRDRVSGDYVSCITCGKLYHWKEVDAGHFVPRDRMSVRFNEKNVNGQCRHCNRFRSGEQYAHGKAIDRKHGEGIAEWLEFEGRKVRKYSSWELEQLIKHYREKVKELVK